MTTNSVIFKATIFPEWFSDRVQPWVHYVPVKMDYTDLYDTLAFFRGGEGGEGGEGADRPHDQPTNGRPDTACDVHPMLLRATAAGISERGTISPTNDCQAGPLKAVPQPTRKVKASRSQGVTRPK